MMSDDIYDLDDDSHDAPPIPKAPKRKKLKSQRPVVEEETSEEEASVPTAEPETKRRKVLRRPTMPTVEPEDEEEPVTAASPRNWPEPTELTSEYEEEGEISEEQSDENAVLPEPVKSPISSTGLAPIPQGATLPLAATGDKALDVNRHWDDFLLSMNRATVIAVWELGIDSITAFTQFSKADLQRPRGRLTAEQADEVERLLAGYGLTLAAQSRRITDVGIRGGMQRTGGLRVLSKALPALPADATTAQRRNHRLAHNRLTM